MVRDCTYARCDRCWIGFVYEETGKIISNISMGYESDPWMINLHFEDGSAAQIKECAI